VSHCHYITKCLYIKGNNLKEDTNKMFNPVSQKSINSEENKIRAEIERLRKQLPRQKARRKKLPDYISHEDYDKFLSGLKKIRLNKNGKKIEKEYFLLSILSYESGMRLSEMVGYKGKDGEWIVPPLSKENIDLQRHTIKIISGKGGKDRIVPLPKSFNEKAMAYIPIRKERRTIQRFFKKYTMQILGRGLSIHKFRHGFASRLVNQGVPINQVQMWMGHSRLDTTGIYLHSSPNQENIEKVRDLF